MASCAGKNSAIRSAVVASVVTLSILVLANIDRMFSGKVFKKKRRRAESVSSNVRPNALRSSKALAKKTEGFCAPSDWDLKYLLKTSDLGLMILNCCMGLLRQGRCLRRWP